MASYDSMDVNIDLKGITKTIKNVEKYETAVVIGIRLGMDELADRTKAKLIENMTMYGLGASPLMNLIDVSANSNGIHVSVGDYAMYIEFGTGVVGKENPHPHPWVYDVNGHGEKGWFYPTNESDPNPNKQVYNGVLYAWTKGQRSRPFMYMTWLWAKRSATQIIRKNVRQQVKKIGGK